MMPVLEEELGKMKMQITLVCLKEAIAVLNYHQRKDHLTRHPAGPTTIHLLNINEISLNSEASCTASTFIIQAFPKSNTKHSFTCVDSNRFHLTLSPGKARLSCSKIVYSQGS